MLTPELALVLIAIASLVATAVLLRQLRHARRAEVASRRFGRVLTIGAAS